MSPGSATVNLKVLLNGGTHQLMAKLGELEPSRAERARSEDRRQTADYEGSQSKTRHHRPLDNWVFQRILQASSLPASIRQPVWWIPACKKGCDPGSKPQANQ
jgi:hypothetical protein